VSLGPGYWRKPEGGAWSPVTRARWALCRLHDPAAYLWVEPTAATPARRLRGLFMPDNVAPGAASDRPTKQPGERQGNMALRAKKPEAVTKRLKLFLFGGAGAGKTTAAIQFPQSYVIDCERGTENYDKLINDSGSAVFQTTDIHEVIAEVKALLTTKHDYRTLVIDPITTVYNDLLDKSELKVGSDFGRHYGAANKEMKRLANLVMSLDMNVVMTAHAKKEYGANLAVIGQTFEGWKQLDYIFDLVINLDKKGKKRFAKVTKTRIDTFPDEDVFEWGYPAIKKRYEDFAGAGILDREAQAVSLASNEQVKELRGLLEVVKLPDGTVDKWLSKAGVETFEDMTTDVIDKCIGYTRGRLPTGTAA
jgi:hypothetical protein